MNAKQTRIEHFPTTGEIARLVDGLITPEEADRESLALIKIILGVANFENPAQADLARAAMNRAYSKTLHCQYAINEGFQNFIVGRNDNAAAAVAAAVREQGRYERVGESKNEEGDYPVVG